MPAPTAEDLNKKVRSAFRDREHRVPEGVQPFSKQSDFYVNGPPWRDPAVMGETRDWLFQPAGDHKCYVSGARDMSQIFSRFFDEVSRGIAEHWTEFHGQAQFNGVLITGPIGIAPPGSFGPNTMTYPELIARIDLRGQSREWQRYAHAVCYALGTSFSQWQAGYSHEALLFPAGAMVMGSMPPSPNVPTPLAAGVSPSSDKMTRANLYKQMMKKHGKRNTWGMEIFRAFSQALEESFQEWLGSQITLVLGVGGSGMLTPVVGAVGAGGKLV